MLALMIAVTMVTLDISVAYTALPAIASDLRIGAASAVWVVNAYHLTMVAAVIPLAALGESFGHRRVHLWGLALFVAGSLACGLAWSLPSLVAARVVQGLGGAAVVSVTTALIRFVYPPHALGRGLGLYALVVAIAFSFGPTVAAAVLALTSWHGLYLLQLPVGVIAIVLGRRMLARGTPSGVRYDLAAALLCAGMFASFVFGMTRAAHHAPPLEIVMVWACAACCGLVLMRRQAGHPAPILAVDLLRMPMLALSSATSILSFAAQGLAFVSLPFLLHEAMGWSQTDTGLLLTSWPAMLALAALNAGRMSERWAAGTLGGIGLALLCMGLMSLALMPTGEGALGICLRLALCGAGFGLFQAPNMNAIMSGAPPHRSGGASGIVATSRMLGQAIGAALAAACFGALLRDGPVAALWLASGFAAAATCTSLMRLGFALPRANPRDTPN